MRIQSKNQTTKKWEKSIQFGEDMCVRELKLAEKETADKLLELVKDVGEIEGKPHIPH